MGELTYSHTLTPGTPENVQDVQDNFDDAKTVINGGLDGDNLTTATSDSIALNSTGVVRRGKTVVATEETTTSASYTTLTTPDQVSDIVLPTDGLITIAYQATWKTTVASSGRAAIFIGSTQLKTADFGAGAASAGTNAAISSSGASNYSKIVTCPAGLMSLDWPVALQGYTGDVTTGQTVGGFIRGGSAGKLSIEIGGTASSTAPTQSDVFGGAVTVFAAAGTYTISVKYLTSSGTLSSKNRALWVKAEAYT